MPVKPNPAPQYRSVFFDTVVGSRQWHVAHKKHWFAPLRSPDMAGGIDGGCLSLTYTGIPGYIP